MKTPRELLLERHQAAEAKLKGIRAEDLAACARAAAEASAACRPPSTLARLVQLFWQETVWPWRRVWAGVAAGWLVILALTLATSDTPKTASARPPGPNPEVLAALQQQEQLLSQLLGVETPPHVSGSRPPAPRSAAEPPPAAQWEAGSLQTILRPEILAEA